jgi:hypothetical protein
MKTQVIYKYLDPAAPHRVHQTTIAVKTVSSVEEVDEVGETVILPLDSVPIEDGGECPKAYKVVNRSLDLYSQVSDQSNVSTHYVFLTVADL